MTDSGKRFDQLKAELNIPYYQVCGILQCLCSILEHNRELIKSPEIFAEAIEWQGSPEALWIALKNAGLLKVTP